MTYAEFVLTDGDEFVVLEQQNLDVRAHAAPGLDALAASGRQALTQRLSERGLPEPSYWRLDYSELPARDGHGACGELRLWTLVNRPMTA